MKELQLSQNGKLQQLLDENENRLRLLSKENETRVSTLLEENEAQVALMEAKHKEEERAAKKGVELDKQRPPSGTALAMPECPVICQKICILTEITFFQVCLEEMIPPMRIFQCQNGHLLCESCRKENNKDYNLINQR